MSRNNVQPTDLSSIIADLSARVDALERSPQMGYARIRDPLDPDITHLWTTDEGRLAPFDITPWIPDQTTVNGRYVAVTSATYVVAWSTVNQLLYTPEIQTSILVTVDAATTGTIKFSAGGNDTSELALAASSQQFINVAWAHGLAIGGGPITAQFQAKRDTGAGNVNVYWPHGCTWRGNTNLITGGIGV